MTDHGAIPPASNADRLTAPATMKYCSKCAAPVDHRIPPGDDRPRFVCDACGSIFYHNPNIVAGCIPRWNDQVLLCRRAIEPRHGRWTLPAGFMENGESTPEAAARETREEANALVEIEQLFCYLSIPQLSQVYVIFLARLLSEEFSPGPESLEVKLFDERDIPWEEIAFPSIDVALKRFSQIVAPVNSPPIWKTSDVRCRS